MKKKTGFLSLALSGVLVQQTRYYLWQHRLDDYDESHIPEGK